MSGQSRTADEQSDPRIDADAARPERLRGRSDGIELIISGLTTMALFSLPGWLFESLSGIWSHQRQRGRVGTRGPRMGIEGLDEHHPARKQKQPLHSCLTLVAGFLAVCWSAGEQFAMNC